MRLLGSISVLTWPELRALPLAYLDRLPMSYLPSPIRYSALAILVLQALCDAVATFQLNKLGPLLSVRSSWANMSTSPFRHRKRSAPGGDYRELSTEFGAGTLILRHHIATPGAT